MIFMNSAGEFSISDPFLRKLNSKKVPFPAAHPCQPQYSHVTPPPDINRRNEKKSMANRGVLSKILLDFF